MPQLYEDWSGHTVQSGVPTGYSRLLGNTVGDYSIVEDEGAPGGKRLDISSIGGNETAIGPDSLSSAVDKQQVFVLFLVSQSPNSSYTPGGQVRCNTENTSRYNASLFRNSSGVGRQQINRRNSHSLLDHDPFSYSPNTVYAVVVDADGSTFRAKIWQPADVNDPAADEPSEWIIQGTDGSFPTGRVGIGGHEAQSGTWRILAVGFGTEGDPAPRMQTTEAPPKPSTAQATALDHERIHSTADEASTATSYNLYQADDDDDSPDEATWALASGGEGLPSPDHIVTGLEPLTKYWFRWTAENAIGESDPSDPVSATTLEVQRITYTDNAEGFGPGDDVPYRIRGVDSSHNPGPASDPVIVSIPDVEPGTIRDVATGIEDGSPWPNYIQRWVVGGVVYEVIENRFRYVTSVAGRRVTVRQGIPPTIEHQTAYKFDVHALNGSAIAFRLAVSGEQSEQANSHTLAYHDNLLGSNGFRWERFVDGQHSPLGELFPYELEIGSTYNVIVGREPVDQDSIRLFMKVWKEGDEEPDWFEALETVDSVFLGAGLMGPGGFSSNTDIRYREIVHAWGGETAQFGEPDEIPVATGFTIDLLNWHTPILVWSRPSGFTSSIERRVWDEAEENIISQEFIADSIVETELENPNRAPNTKHDYRVYLGDGNDLGEPTNWLSITTGADPGTPVTAPAKIENVNVDTVGSTRAEATWQEDSQAEWYIPSLNGVDLPTTTSPAKSLTELEPDTDYDDPGFEVRGANSEFGEGPKSDPFPFSTPPEPIEPLPPPPDPIVNIREKLTPEMERLLVGPHKAVFRVELRSSSGELVTELAYHEGNVTTDGDDATRRTLALQLALEDKELQQVLNPLSGNEIRVYRGVQSPEGVTELIPQGVFDIVSARVEHGRESRDLNIDAVDRSRRVQRARFVQNYRVPIGSNFAEAIRTMIRAQAPWVEFDFMETEFVTPALTFGGSGETGGGNAWDAGREMAESIGAELFFNHRGVCVLRPLDLSHVGRDPVWEFRDPGPTGTIVFLTNSTDNDGVYNRIVVNGESTSNSEPIQGEAADENRSSPTYINGPYGDIPFFYRTPYVATPEQARILARALLKQRGKLLHSVYLMSTPHPGLRVNDPVMVDVPHAACDHDSVYIIQKIAMPLIASRAMNVTMYERH